MAIATQTINSLNQRLRPIRALLRKIHLAQALPWLVACICIFLVWRSTPARTVLPLKSAGYWSSGFYPQEQGERPFRWTDAHPTLYIPTSSIGGQWLEIRLQSGRSMPVPIRVGTGGDDFTFEVAQTPRRYQLLVQQAIALQPLEVHFSVPTFRPIGDARDLGVVAFGAVAAPLRHSLPWWSLTILLLLGETVLLQYLLPQRFPHLLRAAVLAFWMPTILLWLRTDIYGYRGVVAALMIILLSGTICAAFYAGSRPAARELGRWIERFVWRPTPAQLQIQVRAWDRTAWSTASALAGLALLTRILLGPAMSIFLGGDDYLVGAFALGILHGDRLLYYGHHTGTLASYLFAPVLALTGASLPALMVLPIALTAVLTIVLYGLGRDLFGEWGGVAAASWIAIPTFMVLLWSLKPQPGYLEAITFGTLALWLTIRLLWGNLGKGRQIGLMAGIGLAAALAIWAGYIVASILLTCGVAGLLAWRRALSLPIPGYVALIAIPVLFWLLPLAWFVWQHPGDNPIWWVLEAPRSFPKLSIGAAFRGFLSYQLPLLLSGHPSLDSALERMIAGVAVASVLYAAFAALVYRSQAAILVLMCVAATIGLFVFGSFRYLYIQVRYILPLMIALPLLLALLTAALSRRRYGSGLAALALTSVLLIHGLDLHQKTTVGLAYPPRDEAILADHLRQAGVRFIHASYWIAIPVMFESGGQITGATLVGPNRTTYDPRNDERVLAAQGVDTAFVFLSDGVGRPAFERFIDEHSVTCDIAVVRRFVVYHRCTPFPETRALVRALPKAIGE